MSARPRPVTATFTHDIEVDSHQPSGSVTTGSSTASLISVLDHDSCDSCDSDNEPRIRHSSAGDSLRRNGQFSSTDQRRSKSVSTCYSSETRMKPSKNISNGSMGNITSQVNNKKRPVVVKSTQKTSAAQPLSDNGEEYNEFVNRTLSAWEQWVLRKAKEDRDRIEQELEKQKQEMEEAARLRDEKEKKRLKAAETIQAWVEEHDLMTRQRNQLALQRQRAERELKEAKKKETEVKADEIYKTWLEKKKIEDAEKRSLRKELKQKEEREKLEKSEKCKEAIEKWLVEARRRPRTVLSSYGYSSGKLRGYYDASAYPAPSYINPIPWHPVEIPAPPKPVAKKKVTKARWNPAKYL